MPLAWRGLVSVGAAMSRGRGVAPTRYGKQFFVGTIVWCAMKQCRVVTHHCIPPDRQLALIGKAAIRANQVAQQRTATRKGE